jgi:site-specific recombinase XerC
MPSQAQIVKRKPAVQEPPCAVVYLASLGSDTSRASIYDALKRVVRLLTKGTFRIGGQVVGVEDFPWEKIRYRHMQIIRAKLSGDDSSSKTENHTLSPNTVNHTLSAVRGVLDVAWNQRRITTDDYQRARSVKGVKGSRVQAGRHIESAEIKKLFAVCGDDLSGVRDAAVLSMLYGCAMRRAEVAEVKIETLDMDKQSIRLVGKGNKERVLFMPEGTVNAVSRWLELRGTEPGPVFFTINRYGQIAGGGISDEVIRKIIKKLEAAAKVKHLTPHDFRRTSFGNLLEAGVDISTVQKIAGHSSPNTTSRYDRRGEKTRKRAAGLLNVPYEKEKRNE